MKFTLTRKKLLHPPVAPLAAAVAAEPKAAVAAALPVLLLEMQALEAGKGCSEVPSAVAVAGVAAAAAVAPTASAAEAGAVAAESAAQ